MIYEYRIYTHTDYLAYMHLVNERIKRIQEDIPKLPHFKMVSELSYEDWVKFQNGELDTKELIKKYE